VAREPVATNVVTVLVTNTITVFETNLVSVPVTNLVAKPEMLATIEATGSIVNAFLRALEHGGAVTGRAVSRLPAGAQPQGERSPGAGRGDGTGCSHDHAAGQAADAAFVKWLMEHQKEAGVFASVSGLVDQLTDNPAAEAVAREIAERVQKARGRENLLTIPDRKVT